MSLKILVLHKRLWSIVENFSSDARCSHAVHRLVLRCYRRKRSEIQLPGTRKDTPGRYKGKQPCGCWRPCANRPDSRYWFDYRNSPSTESHFASVGKKVGTLSCARCEY